MNDTDLMRKINGLLAKAEGTDNEHEAAAFFEKAQEMMVRNAIDEATLREARIARDGRKAESPVKVDFMFASNDSHSKGFQALLRGVAAANHVRVIMYRQNPWTTQWFASRNGVEANRWSQWCVLVGYETDLASVKTLYASLTIQWARLVRADAKDYSNGEAFAFRTGHLVGFASRVSQRLHEVTERVVAAANANALMVNKDAEIDALLGIVKRCFAIQPRSEFAPRQRQARYCGLVKGHEDAHIYSVTPSRGGGSGRSREVDYAGWNAGRAAGDRADIGLTQVGTRERIKG